MKKTAPKRKPDTTRIILIILCIFLALVLAFLILVAIGQRYLDLINHDVDNSPMTPDEYEQFLESQEPPTGSGETIDPDDIVWTEPVIEPSAEAINILLIGQDRREGQGRQRSDAMILCTINTKTKTVTLTSFMRDLYVQIPGYSPNKMNACYQIGGMALLDACVQTNFGVELDGCVEVDFSGFMKLVDLAGGVDIELTQAEANYLNRRGNWDYNNASAGTWSLTEGVNHLNGEQAFAYSRIRYIGNGDFERTERQRKVITALLQQSKDLSISQLNELLENALPLLTTDLSNKEIISYAAKAFAILPDLKIETQRVPADGTWTYAVIGELDVVRITDMETNVEMLSKAMEVD